MIKELWARMKTSLSLKLLIIFLVFRLLLVLVTVANPEGGILADSLAYLDLTKSIQESGRYESQLYQDEDLLRPPIYPYFLASIRTLFGPHNGTITFFQLILSGSICWMLFHMGRCMGRERAGLVAAWLYALSPNVTLWSLTIMSETLFSFLIAIALFLWIKYLQSSKALWLVWVGLALGLATLIRPIGLYLISLWALLVLVYFWRAFDLQRAAGLTMLFLLAGSVTILPWAIRNWRVHHQFTISNVTTKTFIEFNLAYVLADIEGIDREAAVKSVNARGDFISSMVELAREHPIPFLRTQAFGIARSLAGSETGTWAMVLGRGSWEGFGLLTNVFKGQGSETKSPTPISEVDTTTVFLYGIFVFSLIYSAVLLGLSILGLSFLRKGNRSEVILISSLLLLAAYLILAPGAAGQARFRVPAEPALALLAGYGWSFLWVRNRKMKGLETGEQ
jgi:4-amino-4-deoxy-L-arabinose transferase-like glycosyltransferase